MPDTYFTRKEAIAHDVSLEPLTREEALIQKQVEPLSVKDAAIYALKSGGSTPSDYHVIDLTVKGAASLSILEDYFVSVRIIGGSPSKGLCYNSSTLDFSSDDAGNVLLYAKILLPNDVTGFSIELISGMYYSPTLSYTGLTKVARSSYKFSSDTVVITIGVKEGGGK